ncbi:MAG: hypothetical protein M3539_18350 [Acidobacteriota bacterium]|nr:hypothetical protein [Acidobacteriota bacterium]
MRTATPKLELSHLTANEQAVRRCRAALELKDKGEYDAAQAIMRPLWRRLGDRPKVIGLHPSIAAEVLFTVGILTGWIGSRNEIKESEDAAKDLLTESITLFESLGDSKRAAEARTELACCYWRTGALEEARAMYSDALQRLGAPSNARANALIGLAVVEWSSLRYNEALKLLTDNALLFEKITNHTIKGTYHNQLAMILRKLATSDKKDLLQRVISEYKEADRQFTLARNTVFRAHVKNNIGNVLLDLAHLKEANEYLNQARRLTVIVRDKVRTAQVDETRAQVFIAQERFAEAEAAARSAAKSFEKSGRQCFLAEALTTQGIALARLGQTDRAQFIFQKAIEVAHQIGALNRAGLAALSLIEEIDQLPPETVTVAYRQAGEWLADSQSRDIVLRLKAAGKKLPSTPRETGTTEGGLEVLFNRPRNVKQDLLNIEREMIRKALAEANGSVTHAAARLGMSYQGLAYLIKSRHPDLLKERTPVRRRRYRKPITE